MTDELRVKLDTTIEREIHRFIQGISENVYDRLNIYVRRNDIPIEKEVLDALLSTMKASITEFEMNGLDQFHRNIKRDLDDYVGDENPTEPVATATLPSSPVEATPAQKKGRKLVTVSI